MRKLITILLIFVGFQVSGQVPFMMVEERGEVDTLILVGSLDMVSGGDQCYDVCFDGTYIHVGVDDSIIAYSFNGSTITQEGKYTTSNINRGLYYNDGRIYAATGLGLRLLTFNGSSYTQLDYAGLSGTEFVEVWGNGTYVYAISRSASKTVRYFDGRDSLRSDLSSFTNNEGTLTHSATGGNDVYANDTIVAISTSKFEQYDTAFTGGEYKTVSTQTNAGLGLTQGDTVYYAAQDYSVLYWGLDEEFQVFYTWNTDTTITTENLYDVYVDDRIYSTGSKVYVRERTYPYDNIVTPVNLGDEGRGVWYDGTYIYVADNEAGLKIYQIQKR
jgi:hypothetical protein